MTPSETSTIYQRPAELLQRLIQFDTSNPPGNEAACVTYINNLLNEAGIDTTILARDPQRPNLIARLPGRGQAPPLLLYGHVDVVTTAGQKWSHPPFDGEIENDYLWGRGALDMKSGVAMMIAALLRAKAEEIQPAGDIVLVVLSDEEDGGDFGAKFLVDEHSEYFEGIRYALGEFGGFTLYIGDKRFYPIQIAEKQVCWMKATVRGEGGHGSMPVRGGAMAKLARFLKILDEKRLPVHITPAATAMFGGITSHLGGAIGLILGQLTNPRLANQTIKLLGERARLFDPLLHNTVSPTILHTSEKVNVIPNEITIELDGRLLPGFTPADMLAELRALVGDDVELEVLRYDPGPDDLDLGLFNMLADILVDSDPEGIPVPLLLSGVTDGRFFSKLGIQTYGFTPMQLPKDFNFSQLIHNADERIPLNAVNFGADAIFQAIQRYTS